MLGQSEVDGLRSLVRQVRDCVAASEDIGRVMKMAWLRPLRAERGNGRLVSVAGRRSVAFFVMFAPCVRLPADGQNVEVAGGLRAAL